MAIFGKRNSKPAQIPSTTMAKQPIQSAQSLPPAGSRGQSRTQKPAQSSETTIIANGTKVEAVIDTNTKLHIDGDVKGQVFSNNIVTIGSKGHVKAELKAQRLLISGVFEGNADCDVVEILTGGKFIGKALMKELIIETKAHFEGESKIKKENDKRVLVEKKPFEPGKSTIK